LDFENPKTLDIVDEVMYKIPIQVTNACSEPLGEWNFTVEVKAKDGCFRKLYKTDKTGFVLAELPPMDYLITVREVTPVRQANIPVIEYLKYRPETLIWQLCIEERWVDGLRSKGNRKRFLFKSSIIESPRSAWSGDLTDICVMTVRIRLFWYKTMKSI
jgi:hypothetical protein